MACGATLKRSLEFDPLHSPAQRSPKRRRCMPMTLNQAVPPTKSHQTNPCPFGDISPKLTSEQISAHISAEVKRMQRRRQLGMPGGSQQSMSPPPSSPMDPSASSSSSDTMSFFKALSPNKKDFPLFTFRQVSLVCERMLRDREDQIREDYNQVLTNKLSEQYEAFLKFNHDQLHRRFGERPASYVS